MPHDVFLSYANEDKAIADRACETLERAGIACWIAPRDVRPGVPYSDSILEGIRAARAVVLVLSAAADDSPHVLREVECAVNERIPVLPFQVGSLPKGWHLEYFLGAVHRIDARDNPLERTLSKLVGAIQQLLALDGPVKWNLSKIVGLVRQLFLPRGYNPPPGSPVLRMASPSFSIDADRKTQSVDIMLTINHDYKLFNDSEKECLLAAIGKLLETDRKIQVVCVRPGSVKLTLRLRLEEAMRLKRAVERGELADRGVIAAEILTVSSGQVAARPAAPPPPVHRPSDHSNHCPSCGKPILRGQRYCLICDLSF